MNESSLRGSRPRVTLPQLECLWKFLNDRKDIATGYNKATSARESSKRLWKSIAVNLNAFDSGATKSWREWSKYWNNYKSKLKIKVAGALQLKQDNDATPIDWDFLTEIEKKYLLIIGENYGTILDSGMEKIESQNSSEESLQSIFDPESVIESGTELPSVAPESSSERSSQPNTKKSASVFQQIFIEEDTSFDVKPKLDVNGDLNSLDGLSVNSKNFETNEVINGCASLLVRSGGGFTEERDVSLNRSLVRHPRRRKTQVVPRRQRIFNHDLPFSMSMTLRSLVKATQKNTSAIKKLLREVVEIKKFIKARFPLVRLSNDT